MKKALAIIIAAALVLGLAACGGGNSQVLNNNSGTNNNASQSGSTNNAANASPSENTSPSDNTAASGSEKVMYDGQNIYPGNPFDASKVKEDASIMEIPSCALAGTDTVYTYKDVEITVSEYNGEKVIYSTYFLTSAMKTEKGITIGSTKADMEKAYGTNYKNVGTQYEYSFDTASISFIIEGDRITSITYTLNI